MNFKRCLILLLSFESEVSNIFNQSLIGEEGGEETEEKKNKEQTLFLRKSDQDIL